MRIGLERPARLVSLLLAATAAMASITAGAVSDDDGALSADELNLMIDGPPAPEAPETITRDEGGKATLRAIRLDEPLQIDGKLDDGVYGRVDAIEGFLQQEPVEGDPTSERTEVWIFYDQTNVYISARLTDSHPERMVANEMRRDNRNIWSQNESFSVILDTFYDRRNGFLFRTNPLGALFDAQVTDEKNVNEDWNTVWAVKTARLDTGWTLEMALPFKSLRFGSTGAQVWGINFQRLIKWKNERTHLTQIPAAFDRQGLLRLSFAAALVGVETPTRATRLEVKPYATASLATNLNAEPAFDNQGDGDAGFDVKYGLTKGLTFDFTYNTDFAQVEDDEAQVNLTRFSLFFPEKREFFLEGQGIFNFGGRDNSAFGFDGPSDMPVMFFSRRIGLSSDGAVPIQAGGRVTGRAGAYSIGLLNISADAVPAFNTPGTNFSVVRLKRDIFRRSNIGLIGTFRDQNTDATGANAAFGVDGNFTFYGNLDVNTYYAQTDTPGFDRNDASYRGSVKWDADLFGFQAEHLVIDPDFNPDAGFVRRDNIRKSAGGIRKSIRPTWFEPVRKWDFEAKYDYYETAGTGFVETKTFELESRARLESGDFVNFTYSNNFEGLFEAFEISDGIFIPVGNYQFNRVRGGVWFGGHRKLSGWVGAELGSFFGGNRKELTYRGRVEVTPQISLEPNFAINWIDLPQGSFQTNLITLRGTYTVSPRTFVGALVQYNSDAGTLSTNIRFRWEYQPGSDLFFVYSDGRDTSVADRFSMLENRSLVVKFTRLFRF